MQIFSGKTTNNRGLYSSSTNTQASHWGVFAFFKPLGQVLRHLFMNIPRTKLGPRTDEGNKGCAPTCRPSAAPLV